MPYARHMYACCTGVLGQVILVLINQLHVLFLLLCIGLHMGISTSAHC